MRFLTIVSLSLTILILCIALASSNSSFKSSKKSNSPFHIKKYAKKFGLEEKQVETIFNEREKIGRYFFNNLKTNGKRHDSKIDIPCGICEIGMVLAINLITFGGTPEQVSDGLIDLCIGLDIIPADVCTGAIEQYIPTLFYLIKNRNPGQLTYRDICSIIVQDDPACSDGAGDWMTDWTIDIDPNKPFLFSPPYLDKDLELSPVLQLTDLHLDLHYAEGSWGDCPKPTCCRIEDVIEDGQARPAGHWGDWSCDTPLNAMANFFDEVSTRYDYDYVLFTGDISHHVIWSYSREDNIEHFRVLSEELYSRFPDTPIYPVVGNHEASPCNLFSPESVWDVNDGEFSTQWVYESLTEHYGRDLTEEAKETFRKGGYYTLSPKDGFRIITINSQACYNFNFWILHSPQDPLGQLQWLADTLLEAEKAKEKVWILGHVPPGVSDCWWLWSQHFITIVNRFESIIQAQFYGHKHEDYFKIFFDSTASPPRPTNSLYIGASGTAYSDLNPGYKVYFADGARGSESTWEIANHETYIANLTKANLDGTPEWFKLYEALDEYGLKSLRPADLYSFVLNMVEDNQLFQKYYLHYNKESDAMTPCDTEACKMDQLCQLVTSDISDHSHCDRIMQGFNSHKPKEVLKKIMKALPLQDIKKIIKPLV